jgi:hypothetical protein
MNTWAKAGLVGICWAIVWCSFVLLVGDSFGKAVTIRAAEFCICFLMFSLVCGWIWQFYRRHKGIEWPIPIAISVITFAAQSVIACLHFVAGGWSALVVMGIFPILFGGPAFFYLSICAWRSKKGEVRAIAK